VDKRDLERIAKKVLRELGAGDVELSIEPDDQPDRWRLRITGHTTSMIIRCGPGTTAQFVRTQIFDQFQGQ
jgi:hypothetical protein